VLGGTALVPHVIVVDGQLVGTWRRAATNDGIVIELSAGTRVTAAERQRILAATIALERFHRVPVDVRWI